MPVPDYVKKLRAHLGHELLLMPGICALVFNDAGQLLLGRRSDNGRWAVIGGILEPGENPADACAREVLEETNVTVQVERLTGVYMTRLITYPNGDHAQYLITAFRCRALSGEARVNDDESLEVRYFNLDALPELHPDHLLRIEHSLSDGDPYFAKTGG